MACVYAYTRMVYQVFSSFSALKIPYRKIVLIKPETTLLFMLKGHSFATLTKFDHLLTPVEICEGILLLLKGKIGSVDISGTTYLPRH